MFISFEISYSCAYGFRGYLEFPDSPQKSFITSTIGRYKAQMGGIRYLVSILLNECQLTLTIF